MTTLSQICLLVAVVVCGVHAQYERPHELGLPYEVQMLPSGAREDPVQYAMYRNSPGLASVYPQFYYLTYGDRGGISDRSNMPVPQVPHPALYAPFPLRTGSFRSDNGAVNATESPSTEAPTVDELLNATSEGEENSTVSEVPATPAPSDAETKASLGVINVPKFSNGHHYPLPMWSWISSESQGQKASGESSSSSQSGVGSNPEINNQDPYQKRYVYVPNIMPNIPQQFWSPSRLPITLSYREAEQPFLEHEFMKLPQGNDPSPSEYLPERQFKPMVFQEPSPQFFNEPMKRFGPESMPQFMDGQAENHIPTTAFLPPPGIAPRYYILYADPQKLMQRSQEPRV